jgi:UDP-N-acetylmuramate dehydrogenase
MRWEADVALAAHTRYQVGGPTPSLGRVDSRAELQAALRTLAGQPFRVLGWGANILVSDEGVEEPVLVLEGEFAAVQVQPGRIVAGAGASIPGVVGSARRAGRDGWAFLEAVPGTIGGALRMNAGSAEIGIWDRVEWAEAMTPDGETVRITPAEARPSYRATEIAPQWVFLGGVFEATPGDAAAIQEEHLSRRRTKVQNQVYDLPSCGSIWKNPGPPHGSAWQVVEGVGMRGARRGGAQIAEKHANFIVNLGEATADDIVWLMTVTRKRAHDELGIWLEPEIQLWGFSEERCRSVGATR